MDISLPSSKSSLSDSLPRVIKIEVTFDKQIFLNGQKVKLGGLELAIAKINSDKKNAAIIRADKNLPYGDVIKIMGILQSKRILDISVAVK